MVLIVRVNFRITLMLLFLQPTLVVTAQYGGCAEPIIFDRKDFIATTYICLSFGYTGGVTFENSFFSYWF